MNITKSYKRVMACSCSHGLYLDDAARAEFLRFKRDFDPDIMMHLGDWADTTAMMRSASRAEEGHSVVQDWQRGLDFLAEIEPDVVFVGNHDYRPWKCLEDPRAIVRDLAQVVIDRVEAFTATIGAELVPYTGNLSPEGWRKIGGAVWGHGVMFGENAARDHAEAFNSYASHVVFGHTHKRIIQPGRTMKPSTGYSIGCLCNKPSMHYAAGRRATLAWQHAFLHGEITEDDAWINIRLMKSNKPPKMPKLKLSKLSSRC